MKKTNTLLIFLLITAEIIFINFNSYSQVTQQWVTTYTNPNNTDAAVNDMATDTLGNIYITGTYQTPSQNANYITIKYNSSGVQQWIAVYNGPGSNSIDKGRAIALDKQGNVYVTGQSEQAGFNSEAYCTIKYNNNGVQQWVSRYKFSAVSSDVPYDIDIDNSGNIYVTGGSGNSFNEADYCTIKYNQNGDTLWVRRFGGDGNGRDIAISMVVDKNSNVYVTGVAYGGLFPNPFQRACTIKYNTSGVLQWSKYVPGNTSTAFKIALDSLSDDIYICGNINNPEDYLLVKYNSSGTQQWIKSYDRNGNYDFAFDLTVDLNHNVYVTGNNYYPGAYTTIKYNSSGDTLWSNTFLRNADETTSPKIALDKYSNVYISGNRWTGSNFEFATIKYSTSGIQQWLMTNIVGGAAKIDVSKNLDVVVTGRSATSTIKTIKYSQMDGVISLSYGVPSAFTLYQNYPNPFNNSTIIEYYLQYTAFVTLKVYDILGNEIDKLVLNYQKPSLHKINWNSDKLSSGVYFYKLSTESFTATKKMVLIK